MILPAAAPAAPADPTASAWDLFRKLLPPRLLNDLDPRAPQAAYTPHVVTWLLLYQRLHGNATLGDAAAESAQRCPAATLPVCKRTREHSLSANSGAYAAARCVLHSRVLHWAAQNV